MRRLSLAVVKTGLTLASDRTFSPALDLSAFPGNMSPSGDVERDEVLKQRIRLFSWIEPKHLDLPIPSPSSAAPAAPAPQASASAAAPANGDEKPSAPVAAEGQGDEESRTKEADEVKQRRKPRGDKVEGFLDFAQRELRKMNQYKAPRDKLICVLNCCKVIFGEPLSLSDLSPPAPFADARSAGLIRHVSTGDQGADAFIPFLIYVVIKANPEHLVSNLQCARSRLARERPPLIRCPHVLPDTFSASATRRSCPARAATTCRVS